MPKMTLKEALRHLNKKVKELEARPPTVIDNTVTKVEERVIDRTVTKNIHNTASDFDPSPINKKIDALSRALDGVEAERQVEMSRGEIRIKQPNGEWSSWYKLGVGGGGLSRQQVEEIVTNLDTRASISDEGVPVQSKVTDINFAGDVSATADGDGSVTVTVTASPPVEADNNCADYYIGTPQTGVAAGPVTVLLDTERVNDGAFSLAAGTITVGAGDAGRYKVDYSCSLEASGNNSRSDFRVELFLNGVPVPGSDENLYLRQNNFGATAAFQAILDLEEGDTLDIRINRENGSGTGTVTGGAITLCSTDALLKNAVDWDDIQNIPVGVPDGIVLLDATSKIPVSFLPAIASGVSFLGSWDADANNPLITSGSHAGDNGDFYIVTVAGSTLIDGENVWEVGDAIIWNDTLSIWQKLGQQQLIVSVNGQTGAVVLDSDDIAADDTNCPSLTFSDTQTAIEQLCAAVDAIVDTNDHTAVSEGGVEVVSSVNDINFGAGFDVADDGDDTVTVTLDLSEVSIPANQNLFETVTGDSGSTTANTTTDTLTVAGGSDITTSVSGSTLTVASTAVPTGSIVMWPTATPPTGWLLLDGSTFSAATYPNLNTLLGGNTLPDMRQRFPLGTAAAGTGSTLLGTGGSIDHTHTQPTHTHTQPTHTHTLAHTHQVDPPNTTTSGPDSLSQGFLLGAVAAGDHTHDVDILEFTSGAASTETTSASGNDVTGAGGGDDTGLANPPFMALNFIIRAR